MVLSCYWRTWKVWSREWFVVLMKWVIIIIDSKTNHSTETPKASLRRTFNLLSDVMRKVAKGNVFYIKDAAFKQFNQWIELKAEEVNSLIAEWIKEPSTDLSIITQTPPAIDDLTRDKALSTIHQFMITKATFFSHILADERFLQPVSFTYHGLASFSSLILICCYLWPSRITWEFDCETTAISSTSRKERGQAARKWFSNCSDVITFDGKS